MNGKSVKFRKKSVIIEAIKWGGQNYGEIQDFVCGKCVMSARRRLIIYTLEGGIYAKIGDMIIKGVKGEFHACTLDIFKLTYEEI